MYHILRLLSKCGASQNKYSFPSFLKGLVFLNETMDNTLFTWMGYVRIYGLFLAQKLSGTAWVEWEVAVVELLITVLLRSNDTALR